jgi:hypothetical protein
MSTPPHNPRDFLIKRIRKPHMSHNPTLKERKRPNTLRAINNLIRHDEISRLDLFSERSDCAEGDDAPYANGAESGNVGAVGDFVGCERVVGSVTGEEGDRDGVVLEDGDRRGGRAPRGVYVERGDRRVAFEFLEAGAAYDGNVDWACIQEWL